MPFSIISTCPACGTKNRIPAAHLTHTGKCGSCKGPVGPVNEPIEIESSADFDQIIAATEAPVLVDFWAAWCGPCKLAAPEVHALAGDLSGRALILKVDTDAHQDLAMRYNIQSIPNFVLFRGGRLSFQRAGLASRGEMRRWITLEP